MALADSVDFGGLSWLDLQTSYLCFLVSRMGWDIGLLTFQPSFPTVVLNACLDALDSVKDYVSVAEAGWEVMAWAICSPAHRKVTCVWLPRLEGQARAV